MAIEQAAKNLEEMIEQMFKVARRALQSADATPEQCSVARTLIQRHTDRGERRTAYAQAKTERHQAGLNRRRAEADATMAPVPTDLRSRTRRSVGLPTAEDRAAQAAQEQKRQARVLEQRAGKVRDTTREAKNQAVVAFELEKADFLTHFSKHFPTPKPKAESAHPSPKAEVLSPNIDTPISQPSAPRGRVKGLR